MQAVPAYVGIGSNLGDPVARVRQAIDALAGMTRTRLVLQSSLYGSTPMGPVAQPDYCNAVAGVLTELDADTLFLALRAIESRLGREPPRERWGPRIIDLDLLVFGEQRRHSTELTLPHPGIAARHFVLQPLNEIAPDLWIPGLGRVAQCAAKVPTSGLWRIQ